MEIRLISGTILQKYELTLVSDEELRPTTIPILKIPNNCMLMNLKAVSSCDYRAMHERAMPAQ